MRTRDFEAALAREQAGAANSQQFTLYVSESKLPTGRKFSDVDEYQAYLDSIIATDWWTEKYDWTGQICCEQIHGNNREGCAFKRGEELVIQLPAHMMDEITACHELAHLVLSNYGCGHDGRFVRTYLELIYRIMGSDAYVAAHERFTADGIDLG